MPRHRDLGYNAPGGTGADSMNIARNSVLGGLVLLVTAFGGVSHGQQQGFPKEFHGVYIGGYAENNTCKASDWDKHENDSLFRIDARDAMAWESSCSVKRMRPSPWDGGTSAEFTLACAGEGEISSTREIWSILQIGARKALVMTQLESSDSVPEGSKKMPPLRRTLGARIYLACE
jgi:hypothetical protein